MIVMKQWITIVLIFMAITLKGQNPAIVADLNSSPPASSGYNLIVRIGSKIFYKAVGSNSYPQIWVTDGTQAGTLQLTNFTTPADVIYDQFRNNFAVLGNVLYFTISGPGDGSGIPVVYLWRTDGTADGTYQYDLSTVLTGHIYLDNRICANSNYLFLNIRFEPVAEPSLGAWKIYSISNTGLLQFVKKVSNRQYFKPPDLYVFKDKMLTTGLTNPNADPNSGSPFQQCIYVSDGTPAGTTILASGIQSNAEYDNWKIVGDHYILTRALGWLVKIPGTAGAGIGVPESFYQLSGTNRLLEPYIFGNYNYETGVPTNNAKANVGSTFFFRGRSAEHGWELWKTDGTETGTQLVLDANPGVANGLDELYGFALGNKFVYYTASPSYSGLWATDATNFTTVQLNKAVVSYPTIDRVDFDNGKAYFANQHGSTGNLWQTDGTARGTVQINPDAYQPTPPRLIMGFLSPSNLLYVSTSDFTYKLLNLNTGFRTWYGNVSSSWNDPANWEGNSVPTVTDTVLIPGSIDNNPVIDPNSSVNSLWVERNTVTVNAGATLNVQGELYVLTALSGAGEINFNGSTGSKLGGSGTIPFSVRISSGTVSLVSPVTLPSLNFQGAGMVVLNNYDLIISQPNGITGAAPDRFVVTNGTGRLVQPPIGSAASSVSAHFPVGNSVGSYTPATITNNGTAQQFSVRVIGGLFNSYNLTYPESPATTAYTGSAVNKTWFINRHNNGQVANATVQLQWNAGDELPGLNRSAIQLAHYTSNGWITGPSGSAAGTGPYTYSRSGLTSFSPFGIANYNLALPISLISFNAYNAFDHVILKWQTASEQSSSHFIIERGTNTVDFDSIGRTEASGMTHTTTPYEFIDRVPLSSTAFYRLKMIDRDGHFVVSGIVSVNPGKIKQAEVYPNPAGGTLRVRLSSALSGILTLRVVDVEGRILQTWKLRRDAGNTVLNLDIAKLTSGTYLLLLEDEGGMKDTLRFVKQ